MLRQPLANIPFLPAASYGGPPEISTCSRVSAMWPGRGTVCDQEGSWCTATRRSPRCGCQVVEGRGLEARCPAVIVAVTVIVVVADAARSTSFTTMEDPSSRRPDLTLSSRRLASGEEEKTARSHRGEEEAAPRCRREEETVRRRWEAGEEGEEARGRHEENSRAIGTRPPWPSRVRGRCCRHWAATLAARSAPLRPTAALSVPLQPAATGSVPSSLRPDLGEGGEGQVAVAAPWSTVAQSSRPRVLDCAAASTTLPWARPCAAACHWDTGSREKKIKLKFHFRTHSHDFCWRKLKRKIRSWDHFLCW